MLIQIWGSADYLIGSRAIIAGESESDAPRLEFRPPGGQHSAASYTEAFLAMGGHDPITIVLASEFGNFKRRNNFATPRSLL
jgi:hypothetical protein